MKKYLIIYKLFDKQHCLIRFAPDGWLAVSQFMTDSGLTFASVTRIKAFPVQ